MIKSSQNNPRRWLWRFVFAINGPNLYRCAAPRIVDPIQNVPGQRVWRNQLSLYLLLRRDNHTCIRRGSSQGVVGRYRTVVEHGSCRVTTYATRIPYSLRQLDIKIAVESLTASL